jgi:hypothetical protein
MTTFSAAAFDVLVSAAKASRASLATVSWRKPKLSARRVAEHARSMQLDATQREQLRVAMGRSAVRTRSFRVEGKGHKHERNRIARLELIETRLKEIPKIEQQYKQQLERDKLKLSKAHKGLNIVFTPKIIAASRSPASLVKPQAAAPAPPSLPPSLLKLAQNKHLTALPPHLQRELDALRKAREAKAALVAERAAAVAAAAKAQAAQQSPAN